MKVLFIHCRYQFKGGEDLVVQQEMSLLRSQGIDAELLSFDNETNVMAKLLQLPFNISAYRAARKKLKSYRPDVVHLHNTHFGASPSVIYAAKRAGVPVVMTLHNYRLLCPSGTLFFQGRLFLHSLHQRFPWKAVWRGVYKNSRLLTLWLAWSAKCHQWLGIWKKVDRLIALSATAKIMFLQAGLVKKEEQLVVKPNFSIPVNQVLPERSDHFMFAGRLCEEKGIRLLLQVFSSSTYRLKIAGDGPLKEEVLACCNRHGNIEYLGALEKDEVLREMSCSTALLFPSLWLEGMPMTIIEAFACGTPVIASDLGAMKDMIAPGYTGLLFDAGSRKDLNEKLYAWKALTVLERQAFCRNAWETYQQQYTPEKNAVQLLGIYNGVLNRSSSAKASHDIAGLPPGGRRAK